MRSFCGIFFGFIGFSLIACSPKTSIKEHQTYPENRDNAKSEIVKPIQQNPSIIAPNLLTDEEYCEVTRVGNLREDCSANFSFDTKERKAVHSGMNELDFPVDADTQKLLTVQLIVAEHAKPFSNEYVSDGHDINQNWVSNLKITYDGQEVTMALSAYADLSQPEYVSVLSDGDVDDGGKLFIRFYFGESGRTVLQYKIEAEKCVIGEARIEYQRSISERLIWYQPMGGESLQKAFYQFPTCN